MVRADLNNSGNQGAADKWDGSACDGVSSRAARELSGGRSNALISSRLASPLVVVDWMESTPNGWRAGGSSSSRRLPHVLPSAPLVEASQHVLLQPHPGAFPLSLSSCLSL